MAVRASGGIESTLNGYRIHKFITNGTFTVSIGGNIEILVIAGGGAGGARVGAGGGAGGIQYNASFEVTQQTYNVIIGDGGLAVTSPAGSGRAGNDGGNSTFSTIIAIGGGGGGAYTTPANGRNGGCGGGAGGYTAGTIGIGSQGYNGGLGKTGGGGGGGGIGAVGGVGNNTNSGGVGGVGLEYPQFSSVGGSPAGFFGGGGGGSGNTTAGSGGIGGGGSGSISSNQFGTNGTINTGGGGGGARDSSDVGNKTSGAGGSGIVIIRYLEDENDSYIACNSFSLSALYEFSSVNGFFVSGGNETIFNGYKIHTFTTSGNLTVVGNNNVEVLVVGGGGGGGLDLGGGGGGGGVIYNASYAITPQTYSVIVGSGGTGSTSQSNTGSRGTKSVFDTITAIGGGGGKSRNINLAANRNGDVSSGASGGGGSYTATIEGAGTNIIDYYTPALIGGYYSPIGGKYTPAVIFTQSSFFDANNTVINAFDNSLNSAWQTPSGTKTGWICCQFPSSIILNGYKIFPLTSYNTRAPKDWTFEGSNDGINWTILDTKINQSVPNLIGTAYILNNSTAYFYYRLNISANNGDANYLSVGELKFHSDAYVANEFIPTQSSFLDAVNTVINAFDNSLSSAWQTPLGTKTGWICCQFPSSIILNGYKIFPLTSYNTRAPKDWTFEGSNDGINWTILDTKINQSVVETVGAAYVFENSTAYFYYRLNISANNGDANYLSVGELKFHSDAATALDYHTPSGGIAAASSSYSDRLPIDAFNNIIAGADLGWLTSSGNSGWISYQFPIGIICTGYKIFPSITSNNSSRTPKNWTFEGSNDGSNWIVLDTQFNQIDWYNGIGATYTFNNSNKYTYYKLNCSVNNGDASYTGVEELKFYYTNLNQGFNGGPCVLYGCGGGGGAGGPGLTGITPSFGGNGGIGIACSISGINTYYGGGGGGGGGLSLGTPMGYGIGGLGGGGNGTSWAGSTPGNGFVNTGGGGGGQGGTSGSGASIKGGDGGTGIVIIKYPISSYRPNGDCIINIYPGDCSGGIITSNSLIKYHTFTEAGTFTVPVNCQAKIFAWGGGGAGGTVGGWTYGAAGGAGGAARGYVSLLAGVTYQIVVGGGGQVNSTTGAAGGGGAATSNNIDNRFTGGGGGYSGIFANSVSQANAILIAGGGGGGGSSNTGGGTGNAGGAGGGTTGQVGYSPYDGKTAYGGNPGTQSAAADASCDSVGFVGRQGALQGGVVRSSSYGGGGGGGYWGGSGGGYSESRTMAGGGGGSGYIHPVFVSDGVLFSGNGTTPGDAINFLRGSYGNAGIVAGNGTNGVVIIIYGPLLLNTSIESNNIYYSLFSHIEGFDGIETLSDKYVVSGPPVLTINQFRTGSKSMLISNTAYYLQFNIIPLIRGSMPTTIFIGFGYRTEALASGKILSFLNSSGEQCGIYLANTGALQVKNSTTVLGTSTNLLSINTWYYIEIKCTISNILTTNEFSIRVNGLEWLTLVSQDTQAQMTTGASHINLYTASGNTYYDDIYIQTSNYNYNLFLGPCSITTLTPVDNGSINQFVGSDGNSTDNFQLVDDVTHNSSDYVKSSTIGAIDIYSFSDFTVNPCYIHGIDFANYLIKTDVGFKTIKPVVRLDNVNIVINLPQEASGKIGVKDSFSNINPNTNAAWLNTEINNAQFGIKLES